jgi:hypothetical protein
VTDFGAGLRLEHQQAIRARKPPEPPSSTVAASRNHTLVRPNAGLNTSANAGLEYERARTPRHRCLPGLPVCAPAFVLVLITPGGGKWPRAAFNCARAERKPQSQNAVSEAPGCSAESAGLAEGLRHLCHGARWALQSSLDTGAAGRRSERQSRQHRQTAARSEWTGAARPRSGISALRPERARSRQRDGPSYGHLAKVWVGFESPQIRKAAGPPARLCVFGKPRYNWTCQRFWGGENR